MSLMWKLGLFLSLLLTAAVGLAAPVSDIDSLPWWKCSHDLGTDGTSTGTTSLVASPSRGGQARRFDVSWTAYGGERCSSRLEALDTVSTYYTFDVWLFITDVRHLNNLEFDFNQVLPNRETVIYGTQCSFRVGKWKYTTREGTSAHWNTSNLGCDQAAWSANTWHHLVLDFHRDAAGMVTYDTVSFDGNVQTFIDASGFSNFALRWYPPGLQVVNFQINGDNSANSTTVYLDSFTTKGSVSSPASSKLSLVPAGRYAPRSARDSR